MMRSMAQRGSLMGCLCYLCMSFFEWLIRYFTAYAFVQVAVYGCDFMQAAKNTYQLFTSKGIDAIINDNLSRMVLVTGALVGGIVSGVLGGFLAYGLFASDSGTTMAIIFAIIGLYIGYFFTLEFMLAVDSAIKCIFVCWAEDPAALKQTHPVCFELMSKAWAKVQGTYAGDVEENRELD